MLTTVDASKSLRRIEPGIIMLFQWFSVHYFGVCAITKVSIVPPLRMNKNLSSDINVLVLQITLILSGIWPVTIVGFVVYRVVA